jgi:hypothetical protein
MSKHNLLTKYSKSDLLSQAGVSFIINALGEGAQAKFLSNVSECNLILLGLDAEKFKVVSYSHTQDKNTVELIIERLPAKPSTRTSATQYKIVELEQTIADQESTANKEWLNTKLEELRTLADLQAQVKDLIHDITLDTDEKVERLVQCGIIDEHNNTGRNLIVPRKIAQAILEETNIVWKSHRTKAVSKDIKNYKLFI